MLVNPIVAQERLESRLLLSNYFVAASGGSDTNDGSSDFPWATLQHAANRVAAGDTVTVRPGAYSGFDLWTDGTPTSRIVFKAEPGAVVTGRNARTADGINLEGADYVTIEGFRIDNASGTITRAGIRSVVNAGVVIRNNICNNNGTWGVFTGFSENILIERNTASRSQTEHGIYISNSADNPVVRGNTIWGNRASGIHLNGDASAGGDGIISGALIEANTIYNNGVGGGSGINCDGVQDARIQNNLLYGNHASGISLYRIDGGGASTGNVVVNNTVLVASGGRWALNIQNGSTGNVAFNNILYNEGSYCGVIDASVDSLPGFVSDYNAVMDRFTTDGGDSRLTLAQWRTGTGQDLHSIVAVPSALFVDPTGRDYQLTIGSPAVDAGVVALAGQTAPANSMTGSSRLHEGTHDLGAYEQTPTPVPVFSIVSWESIGNHARGVGEAALMIFDDDKFSEGRLSGVSRLKVTLSASVDPATISRNSFSLAGNGADGRPVDLSTTEISLLSQGDEVSISFNPKLPDFCKYIVRLDGIADSYGRLLQGDVDRVLTALLGDVTGDARVNNTDVGATISLRGTDPIDSLNEQHVRSDVTNDGRINNTDVGGVISVRGRDARALLTPRLPTIRLFHAPVEPQGETAVLLHPVESVAAGQVTRVSFGVPFPKGFVTDLSGLRVLDAASGAERPAAVQLLTPWRDLGTLSNLPSVRSALVQTDVVFPDADGDGDADPVSLAVAWGGAARGLPDLTPVPVRDTWVLIDDSSYPAVHGVYEPNAYALFTPEWYGKALVKDRLQPLGTDPAFSVYDGYFPNFGKTAVNDVDPRVTEANRIHYLTDYEPWLFDRAMTLYQLAFRGGSLQFLREAHRASQFYANHINAAGYFDLKNGDMKYVYGESIAANYWLTGDERLPDVHRRMLPTFDTFNATYTLSTNFWTERHAAYKLLGYVTGYELLGDVAAGQKAKDTFGIYLQMQNNPVAGAPDNRLLWHRSSAHEGGGSELIVSPWMTTLLVDAVQRYYVHSSDERVPEFVTRIADGLADPANETLYYTNEFQLPDGTRPTLLMPYYLGGPGLTSQQHVRNPWDDLNHAVDVSKIFALAQFFSTVENDAATGYGERFEELRSTTKVCFDYYNRPGGPASGLSVYRLSPPRKFNWWFRTTADSDWLIIGI